MEIIKITMSQQKTEERCVIVVDAGLDKFIVLFDWKLAYRGLYRIVTGNI